ncbi:uncharacterized protein I303_103785 [Kwoniella dejecticola CBS 10117]|uniref:Uncharacterized protein n=1 Tax=Kwoniella dejecticola CBS 10117 TaxID=1296121 RepID=A0A1A6A7Q1_9TREE|nr:uncharacterized protein I303_03803 [Kwoniella dejecticola CBS 10117]OBR86085.1 hypothetical protein I303_03803 [Kwoniella dejecticola CBS 10117]
MTTTQATPLPPSHQTPHASLHRFSPSGSSRIYHSSSISPVISNSPPPDNFNPPSASTSAAAKTVNVNTVSEWSTNPFSFSTDNQNDPLIHHDHDPDPDHDHDSHHQRHQQSLSNSASKTTSSSSGSMRKPHPHSTASSPYDIRTDIRINPINHGYFSAAKSGLTPTTNPASVSGYGSGITSSDLNSLLDSQPTSSLGLDMEGGKRNASSEPKDKAQDKDKEGRTIKSDHPK